MKSVIILLGPTGVGKTGAALLLAKALDTEIISADSMQIYRHMDIGTAKPSKEELASVRHHMIDIVEPTESYSAGRYIDDIIPVIEDLHGRGRVPIITGGTGLYIKAITRGIFSGPSADLSLRDELLRAEEADAGTLYARLSGLDPEAARKIEKNDTRRVVRALEVCLTGTGTMSRMQDTLTRPLPYDFIKVGLTRQRKELYAVIDRRVDDMIASGLVAEVQKILAMQPDRTPMQAIGYKEIAAYLSGDISLDEAVRLVKRNSRRYAKRQFTWFRKEGEIIWVDLTAEFSQRAIFGRIMKVLDNSGQILYGNKK
ncbi:MAG: tRNA (adenosine(37)-N6)-dimethylallyltransferase MiaA [Nitrospiraceae bacterium]|nr:tRNA (adenosine(37)-N6)-dimethylallyltransferase MiaA [Nitrospiraceae bacterium]